MTSRLRICFNVLLITAGLFPALPGAAAATVSGRIELSDSRDPGVRKKNFSGVVIWLEPLGTSQPPSLAEAPQRARVIQKDKQFTPHVVAIPRGGSVDFPNLDPIYHNAFSTFAGQPFDVGLYPPNKSRAVTFNHAGIVRVFCHIHPTMSALIAVLDTPWFAVTGANGAYEIQGVPPGRYRMHVFHERALPKTLQQVSREVAVGGGPARQPDIVISETGYLPSPHKNKYGKDYPPAPEDRRAYPD